MVQEQAASNNAMGGHGGHGHGQATGTQMGTTSTKYNIYVKELLRQVKHCRMEPAGLF